jgi:hypothetical protein
MNVARPHPSWYNASGQLVNVPKPYTDGWTYFNPYDFLDHGSYWNDWPPYSSTNPQEQLFFFEHGSQKVTGTVDIVAQFSSQFRPSNSVPGHPYVLGVYELWWQVEPITEQKLPPVGLPNTIKSSFARQPATHLFSWSRMGPNWPCAPEFTNRCTDSYLFAIHRRQFTYKGRPYQSVFDYRNRRIYYSVTNAGPMGYPLMESDPQTGWNTSQIISIGNASYWRFPDGDYRFTVFAADWWGNRANVSAVVRVSNTK